MASSINADNGVISGSSGLKSTADATGVLALQTNGTTAVTVDTSQNVGVGTASPTEKLSVAGNATASLYKLRSNESAPATTDAFIYRPADNTLGFGTASTERFRIGSSGQLGIGASPSYGTSGQVLTSGGSGAAPTWASAPSPAGGATVTNPMSTNITLTSSSNRVQTVSPDAFSRKITLPDATTISTAGGPIFVVFNLQQEYPVAIVDSTGLCIGWAVADNKTEIYLTSTAAAAGNWIIKTGDAAADGGFYFYGTEYSSGDGLLGPVANGATATLGTKTLLSVYTQVASSPGTLYVAGMDASAYGYKTPYSTYGAQSDTNFTANNYTIAPLSDTLAVGAYMDNTTTRVKVFAMSCSTAGGTITTGTEVTLATVPSSGTNIQILAISSTSALIAFNGGTNMYVQAMTISGTTITVGTALAGANGLQNYNTTSLALLSSTRGMMVLSSTVRAFSISGTTLAWLGTAATFGGPLSMGCFPINSTTICVLTATDGTGTVAYIVTDTGTTPTIGSASSPFLPYNTSVKVCPISNGWALVFFYANNNSTGQQHSVQATVCVVRVNSGVFSVFTSGTMTERYQGQQYSPSLYNGYGVLMKKFGNGNSSVNTYQWRKFVVPGGTP